MKPSKVLFAAAGGGAGGGETGRRGRWASQLVRVIPIKEHTHTIGHTRLKDWTADIVFQDNQNERVSSQKTRKLEATLPWCKTGLRSLGAGGDGGGLLIRAGDGGDDLWARAGGCDRVIARLGCWC